MTNRELVTAMFLQWAGVTDPGKEGLSSNPKAQRLDKACFKRFGDKWYDIFNEIMTEYCKYYDEYSKFITNKYKLTKEAATSTFPKIEKIISKI